MIKRLCHDIAFSAEWGRQMRFITGPRQVGKTTMARMKLEEEGSASLYYLWDLREVRNRYRRNELFFTADALNTTTMPWVCFDEIHKMPKWKNILKGMFDELPDKFHFIISGSAKLNITKRAGDSLAGRYFTFQLMPLTMAEVAGSAGCECRPPASFPEFVASRLDQVPISNELLDLLLEYGGFPEPFCRQSKAFHRKWVRDYSETVIREDIGALTRIIDREYIYELYNLLPEMVGSPSSLTSLAAHVQVSLPTIKAYLRRLEDFYLVFAVRPYSKNLKRSLLKTAKYYLYDWTRIKNEGAKFENFVACELWSRLSLWQDATGDEFGLFYIRNKDKQETDFLVTRNGEPGFLVETKIADGVMEKQHIKMAHVLGDIPCVQVCRQHGVASRQARNAFRISATRFLKI